MMRKDKKLSTNLFFQDIQKNRDELCVKNFLSLLDNFTRIISYSVEQILTQNLLDVDIPIIITAQNGELLFSNNTANSLFGLTAGKTQNSFTKKIKFTDHGGKELTSDQLPFLRAFNEKQSVTDCKLKFTDSNGNSFWFKSNSIYISSVNEESEKVVTTFWDITDKMQVEDWFKETAQNIGSVLYSANADGTKYNYISDAASRIFGYNSDDIQSSKILLIRKISPEYLQFFKNFIEKLQRGENAVVEYKIKDGRGDLLFVRHTGFPIIENKKIVRIVGSITNVTDEIEYRNKLEKSEERFRLLIETAEDLIFTLDSNGYFVTVNTLGARTLGYTPEELVGKHFLEFVDEDNKSNIAIAFQEILNREEMTSFEVRFIDKFEEILTFEINARNLKSNHETIGLIGLGRNISERIKNESKLKELNAKLIEANRMISIEQDRSRQQITVLEELNKLKNEFISNISHELRTPLASIVGFAETIVTDKDLPREMVEEFSGIILSEGKRLARLINDILDFSKLETDKNALEKSNFDIIVLLNELVDKWKKIAEDEGLTFSSEIPESEIIINADKERIHKAINNLLSNAVKFTNKGGRITLMARDFLKEVEIIISDTGVGIPKVDIPKLFQKFSKVGKTSTQIPGAGFGLTTVKQIVDLHEGLIKVSSELNKGSTFIIKLPKSSRR